MLEKHFDNDSSQNSNNNSNDNSNNNSERTIKSDGQNCTDNIDKETDFFRKRY